MTETENETQFIPDLSEIIQYDISWMDQEEKRIYEIIAAMLGRIYRQADWRKIASNKIATDIFEHRIKVSSRKPSVPEFINKLCNQLSIQAMHDKPELIMIAQEHGKQVLNTIRKESQFCVMLARRYSMYLKNNSTKKGEIDQK